MPFPRASQAPSPKAKLGIDYESLRKINPGIVYGSISGFGQRGPRVGGVEAPPPPGLAIGAPSRHIMVGRTGRLVDRPAPPHRGRAGALFLIAGIL